jgi:phosphatidylglycerophosphatase A
VIDEFAGQMLTILASYFFVHYTGGYFLEKITLLSFIFFRLFDITKFFPVSYFDNIENAFGVMMDDIMAGVLAFLTVFLVIQII